MAGALIPCPAVAQQALDFEASVLGDDRRRGLSWSQGKAAAQLRTDLALPAGFAASATASTARDATRHGGAAATLDLRAGYRHETGLLQLDGGLVAHIFAGGDGARDYGEIEASVGVGIGPLDLSVLAAYAPRQQAIGGSNLHRRVRLRDGVPGTPLSLSAHFGRSSGVVRDAIRAQRLRPGGAYADWGLRGDYALGRWTLSLAYSDTDIRRRAVAVPADGRHAGAALVASAHFAF